MKFGITLAPLGKWSTVDELVRIVKAAFKYLTLPDHVVVQNGPRVNPAVQCYSMCFGCPPS